MTSYLHTQPSNQPQARQVVELAQQLVRCRSVGFGEGLDRAFSVLASHMQAHGVECELLAMDGDAPVLRTTVSSGRPGPHVLFEGHLDVVSADDAWSFDAFSADVIDGWLLGRGSCDMKSGVAACAEAALRLRERPDGWRGHVTLLVVPDEETGSEHGLLPYLDRFDTSDITCAICAEPTGLDPYLGNRGLIWSRIRISGKASHAGMPELGANPLAAAGTLITSLSSSAWSGNAPTPTIIHAGGAINVIPAEAEVGIDLRLESGEDAERALGELHELVRRTAQMHEDVRIHLEVEKVWPACLLESESRVAQTALRAAQAMGHHGQFGFDQAANDASFLSQAGIPTLIWGPGDPGSAHARDERVRVDQVTAAVEMYVRFAELLSDEEAA